MYLVIAKMQHQKIRKSTKIEACRCAFVRPEIRHNSQFAVGVDNLKAPDFKNTIVFYSRGILPKHIISIFLVD